MVEAAYQAFSEALVEAPKNTRHDIAIAALDRNYKVLATKAHGNPKLRQVADDQARIARLAKCETSNITKTLANLRRFDQWAGWAGHLDPDGLGLRIWHRHRVIGMLGIMMVAEAHIISRHHVGKAAIARLRELRTEEGA